MSIFQKLYDSEINFCVETFWDGGFDVKIGDKMNGFKASACLMDWSEVDAWLHEKAVELFPESTFAKNTLTAG